MSIKINNALFDPAPPDLETYPTAIQVQVYKVDSLKYCL